MLLFYDLRIDETRYGFQTEIGDFHLRSPLTIRTQHATYKLCT